MPILLFVVGAIALILGVGAIGYGIPINEFSFGNTLIIAGSTAAVGGLIIVGLGAVVAKLQRIAAALAVRGAIRPGPEFDLAEAPSRAAPANGRIPFPPRPKPEAAMREQAVEAPVVAAAIPPETPETYPASYGTPSLRNPDTAPVMAGQEMSFSPTYPTAAPAISGGEPDEHAAAPMTASPGIDESETSGSRREPALDFPPAKPTPPPRTAYFEALWPAEREPPAPEASGEGGAEPRPTELPAEPATTAAYAEVETTPPSEPAEPRAVAILKSGVVDGMSYTLYVDGSIEAELPQGTLRFASINDLRQHLQRNS